MKCKKCNAALPEGSTVCPDCGCDNAAEGSKLTPGKIALLVVLAIAAIAVVVALFVGGQSSDVTTEPTDTSETTEATDATDATDGTDDASEATIPADGNPDDVTAKGSYTVPDTDMLAAKDTVVATAGDAQLTNAELQVYYWMQVYEFINTYGDYAAYFGMDITQPLDTQTGPDGSMTWQQYFLNNAINGWYSYKSMTLEGQAAGFEMDEEYTTYLDELPESLGSGAATSGFASAAEMLQADMGVGTDVEAYLDYMFDYTYGYLYFSSLADQIELTAEEIEAYYDENAEAYETNSVLKDEETYVDVRHILVMPTGGTTDEEGNTTYSDEEWETCRQAAQAILDEWLAGDATEESFAALANEKSEDTGSNTNGGLYTDVYVGQMVEEFENWCFDETRQYGDTGLVKTTYGYHVMYFVDSVPVWYATAEGDLLTERSNKIVEDAMAKYPLTVDYSKIAIGTVDFVAES